jgi:large subunit ribosomal protein L44e
MKTPKTRNIYCKKCKKHTEHKSTHNKTTGNRGALKRGSIARAKKRGLGVGYGNLGNYGSKPAVSKWKRAGAKTSKKLALKLTCSQCSTSRLLQQRRTKKVEFV